MPPTPTPLARSLAERLLTPLPSEPLLTPEERWLKSRLSGMGNLTTVLTLLLGIEIAQLRAIEGVETSGFAVVAIIAASVAVGFTIVGLGSAYFCQILLATIEELRDRVEPGSRDRRAARRRAGSLAGF